MPTEDGDNETLSPDAAFAVLGDETRLEILQALGEADAPLAFSELFDRVEYETTANFSYHLERLLGHFVRQTDDGYALRAAGERVVEAVLSGAVTERPVLERTPIDRPCFQCGGTMEVAYREEAIGIYCTDCGGTRGGSSATAAWSDETEADIIGHVTLPPAGVKQRSPAGILHAGEIWTVAEVQALSRRVCPRCSGRVDLSVKLCDDHDPGEGRCSACDQRFRTTVRASCTNCTLAMESIFSMYLLGKPALMRFLIEHDIDPMAPHGFHITNLHEESVRVGDPFEARFTFTADAEAITLTVDDDLAVLETTRRAASRATEPVAETAPSDQA